MFSIHSSRTFQSSCSLAFSPSANFGTMLSKESDSRIFTEDTESFGVDDDDEDDLDVVGEGVGAGDVLSPGPDTTTFLSDCRLLPPPEPTPPSSSDSCVAPVISTATNATNTMAIIPRTAFIFGEELRNHVGQAPRF